MTRVYVVYVEYQSNDPYIVGVFARKAKADAAANAEADKLRGEGLTVYGPDNDVDWDVDIHVQPCEVVK